MDGFVELLFQKIGFGSDLSNSNPFGGTHVHTRVTVVESFMSYLFKLF
jgi:hypothetical protein